MDKAAVREMQAKLEKEANARHQALVTEKTIEKNTKGRNNHEIKVDYTNPAKARADMDANIKEYYDKTAHELAIVLKCYTDAGFTRTEAFEICKMIAGAADA